MTREPLNNAVVPLLLMLVLALSSCGNDSSEESGAIDTVSPTCSSRSGGDIYIRTATDITSLLGCFEIDGNVIIGQSEKLLDLSGLNNLRVIDGDLSIKTNSELTGLTGLENLALISGRLEIVGNPRLRNLEGLNNLRKVGGSVYIGSNQVLQSLDGLGYLYEVGAMLWLDSNPQLSDVSALDSLLLVNAGIYFSENDSVDASDAEFLRVSFPDLCQAWSLKYSTVSSTKDIELRRHCERINWDLHIESFTGNNTLAGLGAIKNIEGDLIIEGSNSLTNLAGLEALETVSGDVIIRNNAQLTSLSGLGSIRDIGGDLVIENNPNLVSIEQLMSVQSVGRDILINVSNTGILSQDLDQFVTGLPRCDRNRVIQSEIDLVQLLSCTVISGDLTISTDLQLPDFDRLIGVEGDLYIIGNANLENLTAFRSLGYVGGSIAISDNPKLASLDGIEGVFQTAAASENIENAWERSVLIINNPELVDLSSLSELEIVGDLVVQSNSKIESLDLNGLLIDSTLVIRSNDNLSNVVVGAFSYQVYDIVITDNRLLRTVSGFEKIEALDDLIVENNSQLASLGDFALLKEIESDLIIRNNDSLMSISILNEVDTLSGMLIIEGNPNIPEAEIVDFRNRFVEPDCRRDYVIAAVEDAEPLANCTAVSGDINLSINTGLLNLSQLVQIDGDLLLDSDAHTGDLSSFRNLKVISGSLSLTETGLTSLAGLENLVVLGGLGLESNPVLTSLEALRGITELENELFFGGNPRLESLEGLNSIRRIGGELNIYSNESLRSFSGLDSLEELGSAFVALNAELNSLDGLNRLARVEGDFILVSNDQLETLTELESLTEIHGEIIVNGTLLLQSHIDNFLQHHSRCRGDYDITSAADLDSITNCTFIAGSLTIADSNLLNLEKLSQLNSIYGDLVITNNHQLTDLGGLENLELIQDDLLIENNSQLVGIDALFHLETVEGIIELSNNPLLPEESEALLDDIIGDWAEES